MDSKVDYKEMYLKMVRATEKAMDILIRAQQECEEMYIEQAEDEESPLGKRAATQGRPYGSAETEL